ncbi:putative disease resistance protein [Vitis vinifera]|uniref:Putative disease resistance protein n=1 Tax=Vitis vinifera TaxID=29760 RepID=A0A438IBE1_VITVI|nr:putative disease resistance protein [Vitis vinifera]
MNGVECVGDEFYGNASFQFLETLSFEDMQNWEKWLCCGEFPHLQKLFIRRCPKLIGKLPEQLLSLVELQIHECPQLLMASLTVPAIRQLRMVDFGKLQLQMAGCDFTALQTSEIEILDVSQWSQLPMAPHQLSIRKCDYVESLLEEEISQTNIHDLKIYDCSFSRSLHKVGLPTTLKSLFISDCSKLAFLLPELFRCHLPVLESLEIKDGGLEKLSILVSEGDPTSLCSLSLDGCPDLESIELHALNLESCKIYRCSKLRSLNLWDCPELLFQREGLPSNLRELEIKKCNQLTPQGSSTTHLSSTIKHQNCPELQFSTGSVLQHLISLKRLEIDGCSRLQSLTEVGLQHLTSLEMLSIENCPMLQSLTEVGLQHLTSLECLWIDNCPMLQSLTKVGLQHLTSLKTLGILIIVSNQDEHKRFLMINKVSIMTMEETFKFFRCLNSPLVQQLAVIGRPCKMCSNQVDFCKR